MIRNNKGHLPNCLLGGLLLCALFAGSANSETGAPAASERGPAKPVFDQDTHSSAKSHGTEGARVDAQITLNIPVEHAQEVYHYLRATYADSDAFVKKNFPGMALKGQTRVDISKFMDEYYDTPNFDFYKNNSSIRHRKRESTTDETDRKSGRELVQIKYTPPGRFEHRTEVKFNVEPSAEPGVAGLVQEDQREDFKRAIAKIGFDAATLKHVLTNHQTRSRVYVDWDGKGFISMSTDEYVAGFLWAEARLASVDIGLQENDFTEADDAKRQKMWETRDVMIKDLLRQFPYLTQNSDEKYSLLVSKLAEDPWYKLFGKLHLVSYPESK
jgi:hypothetical protein